MLLENRQNEEEEAGDDYRCLPPAPEGARLDVMHVSRAPPPHAALFAPEYHLVALARPHLDSGHGGALPPLPRTISS
jgi:hypothetical protein